ncbi:MAG: NAD(P)-dependent oxidoreductase [Proteobacteria bacterium]|nr:NAD(P)-dependent oxidoreductase [Pseudomonadota bacterium]
MKIGLCGTGTMGAAMGAQLMDRKHKLTVWNRTARRAKSLVDAGATRVETPAELFDANDVVINITIDDKAVRPVYEGRGGLLSTNLKGKLVIEMSTLMPETTRRLEQQVKAAGGAFVECPVGGGPAPARSGNLIGMAGGTPAAFKRAKPILDQLCRRLDRMGPVGAGNTMKLAINLPLLAYWEALGEAISLTETAGIKRTLAADILADSSGAAKVAPARLPWIMEAIGGKFPASAGFQMTGGAKDAAQMVALAKANGFKVPVIDATRKAYKDAVNGGWADRDFALLSAWRAIQSNKRKPAAKKAK